jgi:hypothetical protein
MRRGWSEHSARSRDDDAFAERLEGRLHALAIVLATIVLGMRLIAGTGDLMDVESTGYEPIDTPDAPIGSTPFL